MSATSSKGPGHFPLLVEDFTAEVKRRLLDRLVATIPTTSSCTSRPVLVRPEP
ncbi:hypothetical protein [Streptomyces avicenniae]|uniref:hypothetical protein n=1 Tax=Streptomyces avicenniae TaxID=500153 RepID=UPI00167C741D|nr:hypothetical protein [Streptomyces avicenniae]